MPLQKPITIEVLAYAPTQFYHCLHCEFVFETVGATQAAHEEQLASAIPDDLKAEYANVSDWVRATVEAYGGRIVIKVIDAASVEGLLKSVRYNARKFPAVIVEGKDKYIGSDLHQANSLIDKRLALAGATS